MSLFEVGSAAELKQVRLEQYREKSGRPHANAGLLPVGGLFVVGFSQRLALTAIADAGFKQYCEADREQRAVVLLSQVLAFLASTLRQA